MESMMAPSLALDADGVALAIGSAGGSRLRTALVGVSDGVLREGLDPQEAVDRPRFHPGRLGPECGAGRRRRRARDLARLGLGRPRLAGPAPLLRRRQPDRARRPRRGSSPERRCPDSGVNAAGAPDQARYAALARSVTRAEQLHGSPPRRARSGRRAPAPTRTPPRPEAAARARRRAAARTGRPRSRAGTPRPEAAAPVGRVRPDRDGRAGAERRAGVDPEPRHEHARGRLEVRGRESEAGRHAHRPRRPALRPREDVRAGPRRPRRPPPRPARGSGSTRRRPRAAPAGLRTRATAAARDRRARPRPNRNVVAGGDHARAERREVSLRERGRVERASSRSNGTTRASATRASASSSSRRSSERDQRDRFRTEDAPRVRVEGDHRRRQTGGQRRRDDGLVSAVHAVERPDRDRARPRAQLVRACERPSRRRRRTAASRASASSAGTIRSGSASSTENGPTSRRRSVRQWPPSASAIARTYVPELTRRSSGRHALRIRDDVERVDPRAAQGHLDRDAPAVQAVGALAADLHRRGGRDRQLDLTAEAREPCFELSRTAARAARRLPLRVARGRPRREVDVREVALVQSDEGSGQLSCPTGQQEQQSGRKRVERPGVAGARASPTPHLGDDRERRRPRRLVHQQDPGRLEAARRRHPVRRRRAGRRTAAG